MIIKFVFIHRVYVMFEVFKWIKTNGGLKGMEINSIKKSKILYDIIDDSNGFFVSTVNKNVRSRMNVTFRIPGECSEGNLEDIFLKGAEKLKMIHLKGHRYYLTLMKMFFFFRNIWKF